MFLSQMVCSHLGGLLQSSDVGSVSIWFASALPSHPYEELMEKRKISGAASYTQFHLENGH